MKLLVFAGSTRQNSFNRQLAVAAAAIANDAGAEVTHLELATLDLPLYNALLKNAIDWASSPVKGDPEWNRGTEAFEGKVVGLLSTSPGPLGGLRSLSHLNPLLLNLQCVGWHPGSLHWAAPDRPLTRMACCRVKSTARACKVWSIRCSGPAPDFMIKMAYSPRP